MSSRSSTDQPGDAQFASDNAGGIHPALLEQIVAANAGFTFPYGRDTVTLEAEERVLEAFRATGGRACFVATGTGANILGLDLLLDGRDSRIVVCSDVAHIHVDECGAPERILGARLLDIPTDDGRLTVEAVREAIVRRNVNAAVLSVTQPTELGTVYALDELRQFRALCDEFGLGFHIDGARIFSAAVALDCSLADTTTGIGADIISVGGTKIGLPFGEVMITCGVDSASQAPYARRQLTQLIPKMRFVAAGFHALLEDERWRSLAGHAIGMATRLERNLSAAGVTVTYPVRTNMVYVDIGESAVRDFVNDYPVYTLEGAPGVVRLMTCWATELGAVDAVCSRLIDGLDPVGALTF